MMPMANSLSSVASFVESLPITPTVVVSFILLCDTRSFGSLKQGKHNVSVLSCTSLTEKTPKSADYENPIQGG